ncbi:MAG: branched-chain amino acid aminotransferase [Firmicutes bacterium]|nr:branched-chain amino acid aminotransferase [Bacillota bacterium]
MKTTLTKIKKEKPDFGALGFCKYFSDHMLVMDYKNGAWQEPEIMPYGAFELNPATSSLHYGQGIFEGLKAYKNNGKVTLFRPRDNFVRMNKSANRLCIPEIDVDLVLNSLIELIKLEEDWIPEGGGRSLYIRPFIFATDNVLGVASASNYRFAIILSPVGSYYAGGLKPTRILVEEHFVRASIGGTGEAKCIGNYAASLFAGNLAKAKGYDQVMWLDSSEHLFVEEVGSMNMFFVEKGKVKTPSLVGSILPGITRDSAIKLLTAKGIKVEETRISIKKVAKGINSGALTEAFGTGTAAVISPVGTLGYQGKDLVIGNNEMGEISSWLYDELTGIQCGIKEDKFGWVMHLN